MHTDEYEISLWRELKVCADYAKKCRRQLDAMESRYGMSTEAFLERSASGALVDKGFTEWKITFDAFQDWSRKHEEYSRLLRAMKL